MSYEGQKRRVPTATLCAFLVLLAGGCRHRVRVPVTPIELRPVEPINIPEPVLPMIAPPDELHMELPIASAAAGLHRERRRTVRPGVGVAGVPAPAGAGEETPDDSVVGDLSAGGESGPMVRQEAESVLKDNDRRLRALPESLLHGQRSQVSKVRDFQRRARQALTSSDIEGAKTLAIKAKLLLDDLEK